MSYFAPKWGAEFVSWLEEGEGEVFLAAIGQSNTQLKKAENEGAGLDLHAWERALVIKDGSVILTVTPARGELDATGEGLIDQFVNRLALCNQGDLERVEGGLAFHFAYGAGECQVRVAVNNGIVGGIVIVDNTEWLRPKGFELRFDQHGKPLGQQMAGYEQIAAQVAQLAALAVKEKGGK
jgi:hypothetical protein